MGEESRRSDYAGLLELGTPIVGSALAALAIGALDTAMMGRYSVAGLAAVGVGAAVFALAAAVVSTAAIGFQIKAAQLLGAKAPAGVGRAFVHAAVLVGSIATALALAIALLAPAAAGWIGGDQVRGPAAGYLWARAPALVAMAPTTLLRSTFNVEKKARYTLYTTLTAGGVNLILDYLFIFGVGPIPELGAIGNGFGSTGGGLAGLVAAWALARRDGLFARLHLAQARFERAEAWAMVRLASPLMISMTLGYAGNLVLFAIIGQLGDSELGAARVLFQIQLIAFAIPQSMASACQITLGRLWGERRYGDAARIRRRGTELLGGLAVALALPLLLAPQAALGSFTDFPAVRAAADGPARLLAVSIVFVAWSCNSVACVRAVGRTSWDMYATVVPVWLIELPLAWLLGVRAGFGLTGVYAAVVAYWMCRAAVSSSMATIALGRAPSLSKPETVA